MQPEEVALYAAIKDYRDRCVETNALRTEYRALNMRMIELAPEMMRADEAEAIARNKLLKIVGGRSDERDEQRAVAQAGQNAAQTKDLRYIGDINAGGLAPAGLIHGSTGDPNAARQYQGDSERPRSPR